MPKKLKTKKAISKRFIVKKSKKGIKVIKRAEGQDHFNSRESGNTKRNKRSDVSISREMKKVIVTALPYNN
ncbi:MAG: 50S ribosomal protein L35 [Patescibacteria group bacterium]